MPFPPFLRFGDHQLRHAFSEILHNVHITPDAFQKNKKKKKGLSDAIAMGPKKNPLERTTQTKRAGKSEQEKRTNKIGLPQKKKGPKCYRWGSNARGSPQ